MRVGVLGGGQLAKMLGKAANDLNIDLVCVDPASDACAAEAATVHTVAFDQLDAIAAHFSGADCVTFETENLPIKEVEAVAAKFKLSPSLEALRLTQDRLLEKDFLNHYGVPTVDYLRIDSWQDLEAGIKQFGFPVVLKTRREGYDGKGQCVIKTNEDAKASWEVLSKQDLILEKFIQFDKEVSLIAVRSVTGGMAFYPLVQNTHREGILRLSQAPYVNEALFGQAKEAAGRIMSALDYVGVMTIEFFCVGDMLIANEIAPRVHNSGHWTIEGAATSQFENHLRAITGMPLGSTEPEGCVAMINIIGEKPADDIGENSDQIYVHWYGKAPRPGRKLGHITICAKNNELLAESLNKVMHVTN